MVCRSRGRLCRYRGRASGVDLRHLSKQASRRVKASVRSLVVGMRTLGDNAGAVEPNVVGVRGRGILSSIYHELRRRSGLEGKLGLGRFPSFVTAGLLMRLCTAPYQCGRLEMIHRSVYHEDFCLNHPAKQNSPQTFVSIIKDSCMLRN